jgi:hypothetical protein
MSKHLPAVGSKCYFMHKQVTVLKVWGCFQLAEIKEIDGEQLYLVDVCTLSRKPNITKSISLRLFEEEEHEHFALY